MLVLRQEFLRIFVNVFVERNTSQEEGGEGPWKGSTGVVLLALAALLAWPVTARAPNQRPSGIPSISGTLQVGETLTGQDTSVVSHK